MKFEEIIEPPFISNLCDVPCGLYDPPNVQNQMRELYPKFSHIYVRT